MRLSPEQHFCRHEQYRRRDHFSCCAAAALLAGITTPEKFVFDEVHYVPTARQMLEPVMPQPMLNPMHPPLAKHSSRCRFAPSATTRWAGAIRARCSTRSPSLRSTLWNRVVCRSGACDRLRADRLLQPDAVRDARTAMLDISRLP
jgi:hypothetical protein